MSAESSGRGLYDLWKEQRVILAGEMDDASWARVSQAVELTRLRATASDDPEQGSLESWNNAVDLALVDLRLLATTKLTDTVVDDRADEREALRNALHRVPSGNRPEEGEQSRASRSTKADS